MRIFGANVSRSPVPNFPRMSSDTAKSDGSGRADYIGKPSRRHNRENRHDRVRILRRHNRDCRALRHNRRKLHNPVLLEPRGRHCSALAAEHSTTRRPPMFRPLLPKIIIGSIDNRQLWCMLSVAASAASIGRPSNFSTLFHIGRIVWFPRLLSFSTVGAWCSQWR